jgi:hypothetical protein
VTEQKLTRRRLLAITGAGAATAAGVATLGIVPSASAGGDAIDSNSRQLSDAVLAAFRRHRIVAVGEVHGQQEHHDALQTLLLDPRLPAVVNDIVVEFGNALYQPTMDRFVAGPAVEDRDLRLVWRNTTQSPVATLDAPMYEQFFRTVRAANWPLPEGKKIRVLLGDPPIDWARVTTRDDVLAFSDRDGHMASVLKREVVDKGRRALVCYGSRHVMHAPPGEQGGGGVAQVEQQTGHRAYVILAGGHPRLASHPGAQSFPRETPGWSPPTRASSTTCPGNAASRSAQSPTPCCTWARSQNRPSRSGTPPSTSIRRTGGNSSDARRSRAAPSTWSNSTGRSSRWSGRRRRPTTAENPAASRGLRGAGQPAARSSPSAAITASRSASATS